MTIRDRAQRALLTTSMLLLAACEEDVMDKERATDRAEATTLSFFVTSDTSATGDLGGLLAADARCERLASAVGQGKREWRAYLSVEHDAAHGGKVGNARDRIGAGPWYNANGVLIAENVDALHARMGDPEQFVDERGNKINGQWEGSPAPNEHDILTGSDMQGNLVSGKTCNDWTSADANLTAQVGHSDGLGPMRNGSPPFNSWQSARERWLQRHRAQGRRGPHLLFRRGLKEV